MEYRSVGKSGLKVSEIAVGSWMTDLGGSEKAKIAEDTIRLAYENGINFFDCADAYSGGEAERFLGRVLKDYRRSSYVVSSKVFFPTGLTPMSGDYPENIFLKILTGHCQICSSTILICTIATALT